MTRDETKQLIMVMSATFPNFRPDNLSFIVDTWKVFLADYDAKIVNESFSSYVMSNTSGFAPSIGQLVDIIQMFTAPEELSELEAWGYVSKALRNSSYGATKEFLKLPPIVQKCVGSPQQLKNWGQTDIESVENVIQSNFMRTYRAEVTRKKEIEKMPVHIKQLIKKMETPVQIPEESKPQIEERAEKHPINDKLSKKLHEKMNLLQGETENGENIKET